MSINTVRELGHPRKACVFLNIFGYLISILMIRRDPSNITKQKINLKRVYVKHHFKSMQFLVRNKLGHLPPKWSSRQVHMSSTSLPSILKEPCFILSSDLLWCAPECRSVEVSSMVRCLMPSGRRLWLVRDLKRSM